MTTRNPAEFSADQERKPTREERRDFLRLSGATIALAAAGCSRAPRGKVVPYASQPPEVTPGVASHYATTLVRDAYGVGVIVESHEGRPTKIEGNPRHPGSLGGTGIFEQATILGVYDRDRGRHVTRRGAVSSFDAMAREAQDALAKSGAAIFLLEPTSSPLTVDLVTRAREKFPRASFHFQGPLSPSRTWEGARLVFGEVLEPLFDLHRADLVVALDSDFLTVGPASLRYARHFAERRRIAGASESMNRLYCVEPAPTVTGSTADHRIRMRRSEIDAFARALLSEVAKKTEGPKDLIFGSISSPHAALASAVAKDLLAHCGRAAVLVGEAQPPIVHAVGHAINALLGAFEGVASFIPSPIFEAGGKSHDPSFLAAALDDADVTAAFVLGGNPVYASPRDLDLTNRLRRAPLSVHLGRYENETSRSCDFFVPQSHILESWGSARAFDGTESWIQPLLAPITEEHRSVDELLAAVVDDFAAVRHGFDLVSARTTHESLRTGIVDGSAFGTRSPAIDWQGLAALLARTEPKPASGLELVLREDARVRDGAETNNPWLLELPDPTTKLTWENAVLVSRSTAARIGVESGEIVTLEQGGAHVDAPVLVTQGHADDCASLAFGYGRSGTETIADGVGANAFALRTIARPWGGDGLTVTRTGRVAKLALAQSHFSIEGRSDDIFLRAKLSEFRASPDFAKPRNAEKRSLYVLPNASPRQWGMVVDLSACTGCSACVVACQAENNIAVVGKAGVMKGREMHWLRIDRYVADASDDARPMHEPMLCQHCERAPCEYVCPVNATTHSADGMNQMTYNRCVGTRFCSNNCPWKVRRFNWFDYDREPDAADPRVHNPDVTVRARGVMEKCTYCVQRVREAEIRAKVEGRELADHDVMTACEQACPSAAIVFGDIGDPRSEVSAARKNPRLFGVLDDLGTRAHTRYLAKIDNPNEEIE